MNPNYLDEISERIRQLFAQSPAADLEKNLRALLASFFARLDLVTREEFDVQRQVLLRTREKTRAARVPGRCARTADTDVRVFCSGR